MLKSGRWMLLLLAVVVLAVLAWDRFSTPSGEKSAPQPVVKPTPGPTPEPTPSAADRLQAAEAAAFPQGLEGETDEGAVIRFQPGVLVDAPFGPVLVSEGRVEDAAHSDQGVVAIQYLAPDGKAFRVTRSFPQAVRSGSFGRMAQMTVSLDFSDLPVVRTEGGGTWQGYTCGWTTLTELQPDGPVRLVRFLDMTDDSGAVPEGKATTVRGKITKIVQGKSFTVHFTGSRTFDAVYVRKGDHYEVQGGAAKALQGC